jgi:hypothetical protein
VRGVVYYIEHHIPPFHFIEVGGRHVHHLVIGIVILLLVGYGWLAEVGTVLDLVGEAKHRPHLRQNV